MIGDKGVNTAQMDAYLQASIIEELVRQHYYTRKEAKQVWKEVAGQQGWATTKFELYALKPHVHPLKTAVC